MKESNPFYHTSAWKKARRACLLRDNYMCVECVAEFQAGGVKPQAATMVHHILPITDRPDLALDIDNMVSLCDMHHNREHPEKGGQGRAASRTSQAAHKMRIIKI